MSDNIIEKTKTGIWYRCNICSSKFFKEYNTICVCGDCNSLCNKCDDYS